MISKTSRAFQEIGVFGCEGMGSYAGLMSPDCAPFTVFMQIGGEGHRIRSERLSAAMGTNVALRTVLSHYMYAFGIQVAQTAVANVQCNITERLSRWVLMMDDRVDDDIINVTHEFLAEMLGVGRTGVTLALHELENAQLIRTGRKRIEILNRPGLEAMCHEFYGFAEREYRRIVLREHAVARPRLDARRAG